MGTPELESLIDSLFDQGSITERYFISDRGLSNTKFRYSLKDGSSYLVRVNERVTPEMGHNRFEKARFCSELCRTLKLPVPEVQEVGMLENGRPYSIENWISGGVDADLIREPDQRAKIWENLGCFASKLHQLDLSGREADFHLGFDGDSPTQTWQEHLANLEDVIRADKILELSPKQREALIASLREFDLARYPLSLSQGDLKLDNVIVDRENLRILGVLDWEIARLVPKLLGEMSTSFEPAVLENKKFSVARDAQEREAFLRGYGVSSADVYQDFVVFYAGEVFMLLNWYQHAIYESDRPDKETLKVRLKNYLSGIMPDIELMKQSI